MKNVILSMAIASMMVLTSCNQSKESNNYKLLSQNVAQVEKVDVTFGVRGNCGMCKATIEKAVNNLDGIAKAVWDVDKEEIKISYDISQLEIMDIHQAIAATGYDTDSVKGNDEAYQKLPGWAYQKLPGCCQYDDKRE